ncbi:HAD family phosphatase [Salinicoccus sp. ID82-1]|uniref:HAD family phosphatase n=1 Tax=Salinicoccus cyprini TaxID=2493691 RepID=A0A558ARY5_9STAP|nr:MULTISPECIES: Cof-type HAD-IIB family hydrolase [Salinicoccus]MCG1009586.1 HAD family phosphatase [Salinicoccus sp. ID82-1]TVT27018.1 HAD family phosphatase [Salinicoccus cyprini]
MVKLIALDMDGTLLTPGHEISPRNKAAISKAMERGVQVVVATGRAFYEAHGIINKLDMKLPYICLNGAEVRNESSEVMTTNALNAELIEQAADVFRAEDIFYQVYTDRAIYTASIEQDIEIFKDLSTQMGQKPEEDKIRRFMEERLERGTLIETDDYKSIFEREDENVLKLLAASSSKPKLVRAKNSLYEIGNLAVSASAPHNIELTHVNAQKGIALANVAEIMGIDMKDVMAVGDNLNDISMLKRAGISVAMGNAASEVKGIADKVTATNIEDGVAIAIEEALEEMDKEKAGARDTEA